MPTNDKNTINNNNKLKKKKKTIKNTITQGQQPPSWHPGNKND
jgi:hypothetical protein